LPDTNISYKEPLFKFETQILVHERLKDEDVSSYWMALRKGADTEKCKRAHWISLGELAPKENTKLLYNLLKSNKVEPVTYHGSL